MRKWVVIITAENIIIAKFKRNLKLLVDYRYQYDYGQILQIEGLELPTAFEAHFSNSENGESITQVGTDHLVNIPDDLFKTGDPIYCWVYVHEGEHDGRTKYMIVIPIKKRAEITDIEPTPEEQSAIEQVIVALNIAVDKSEQNVLHYPKILDDTWFVYDANEDTWINTGVIAKGVSPEIDISTIDNGHKVTIIDADGEKEFDVTNGEDGKNGVGIESTILNNDYTLTITLTDGTTYTTPSIRGERGEKGNKGDDGVSIVSTTLNNDYTLTILLSDGASYTTPSIRGTSGFSPIITTKQKENGYLITIKTETNEETIDLTDGEDGVSPSVSISESVSGQHTISITDRDGTKTFNVLDGENGLNGTDGVSPEISVFEEPSGHEVRIEDAVGTSTFFIPNGSDGQDGHDGTDGVSPIIITRQITGGYEVTIQDASGTRSFDLYNGINGTDGHDGQDGSDGVSPTISINEITGGHEIEVTDTDGTQTFEVLDGENGEDGFNPIITPILRDYGYDIEIQDNTHTETISIYNGQDGQNGQNGADGFSPVIDISNIQGGHTVHIEDALGIQSFDVMDGATGAKGDKGDPGLTAEAKEALLDCLLHTAWTDDDGRSCFNALYTAMGGAEGITLDVDSYAFGVSGETMQLNAVTLPVGGEVTWVSSDDTVTTVSDGLVTAVGNGTATITASCGDASAECEVKLTAPSSISAVYTPSRKVHANDSLDLLRDDLTVTAVWSDGTEREVKNYTLSGTLAVGASVVTVTYSGKTTTINVEVLSALIYDWDFTKSLTDKVSGNIAELLNGLSRTDEGLYYNTQQLAVKLPSAYGRNRTIEIDIADWDIQSSDSYNVRFVMFSDSNGLLIWRHSTTIGWSAYNSGWSSAIYGDLTTKNIFANCTVKIVVSSDGKATLYKDDVLIGTVTNTFPSTGTDLWLGSTAIPANGGNLYNVVIKGVRIY